MDIYSGLIVRGTVGATNQIQYTTNLANTNSWVVLTNFVLPRSPYLWVDTTTPAKTKRFYRAIEGPVPVVVPLTNIVWIMPGNFMLGSPTNEVDRDMDESPQTQVTITKGFWMGRLEVTRREFARVMGYVPGFGDFLDYPANDVSWNEAVNYCSRLTQQERTAGRLTTNYFYRLPTEAQWEYAARAGTTTRFSHGNDPGYVNLPNYAWFGSGSYDYHDGGLKRPNAWGLYDMYGNVYEWCLDWYDRYPGGSVVDWTGSEFGTARVVRGGGQSSLARECRSANRHSVPPASHGEVLGFRIVLVNE